MCVQDQPQSSGVTPYVTSLDVHVSYLRGYSQSGCFHAHPLVAILMFGTTPRVMETPPAAAPAPGPWVKVFPATIASDINPFSSSILGYFPVDLLCHTAATLGSAASERRVVSQRQSDSTQIAPLCTSQMKRWAPSLPSTLAPPLYHLTSRVGAGAADRWLAADLTLI